MTQAPNLEDELPAIPTDPSPAYSERPSSRPRPLALIAALICGLLALAYLGNAAWNLLHSPYTTITDSSSILAAVTLPVPLTMLSITWWIELASAAGFLLICLLGFWALRRALKRPSAPLPSASAEMVASSEPALSANDIPWTRDH